MSDTSMTIGSRTQVNVAGAQLIRAEARGEASGSTATETGDVPTIAVRVVKGLNSIVLRVNPKVLCAQQRMTAINENIRLHGKTH
ncbi:unnamed protein product [Tuwongella immobilis]|uniref:Uncharacterized protein n=1 Tax=Tuwongella immobilis TaxID=692036 RepID=A0A6C2YJA3_9BACT|nr:unnamed protein product [Tuwongella immobilis]VTR99002.1 unnamed protein product [Tuwongella immobilis]